jgi:lysozyme
MLTLSDKLSVIDIRRNKGDENMIKELNLTMQSEGCKLSAYLDSEGIPTIGWGSIWIDGRRVKLGDSITQEKANSMLEDYFLKEVKPTLDKLPSYITDNQKEALTSLIYNWNSSGFLKSKLYQAIIKKDKAEIIRQWDYGFKNDENGLYIRRIKELALFVPDFVKW